MSGWYPSGNDPALQGYKAPDEPWAGAPTQIGSGVMGAGATAVMTPFMGPFAPVAGAFFGPLGGLMGSFFEPDPEPIYSEPPPPMPAPPLPGSAAMYQIGMGAYGQPQQPYAAQYGVQNPYGFR